MMFTSDEIALLVASMKRNGVAELDIRHDAEELRLVSAAGARPGPSSSPRKSARTISATAFGVLDLEATGPLAVGASIAAGDIVATVAVGPLRRPVVSPVAGKLTKILGRQGQRVEYGTPLFEILETKGLS